MELDYTVLTCFERVGAYVTGVKILVSAPSTVDLNKETIRQVASRALEDIHEEILAEAIEVDPAAKCERNRLRQTVVGLFSQPIFVEEIPNGYCSRACCRHLPWFIVTTKVGRIKIGRRKSVILIDWSDSPVTVTANELFPDQSVTKEGRSIHAWDWDRAKMYLERILNACETVV